LVLMEPETAQPSFDVHGLFLATSHDRSSGMTCPSRQNAAGRRDADILPCKSEAMRASQKPCESDVCGFSARPRECVPSLKGKSLAAKESANQLRSRSTNFLPELRRCSMFVPCAGPDAFRSPGSQRETLWATRSRREMAPQPIEKIESAPGEWYGLEGLERTRCGTRARG
jgi:hypothetical protein